MVLLAADLTQDQSLGALHFRRQMLKVQAAKTWMAQKGDLPVKKDNYEFIHNLSMILYGHMVYSVLLAKLPSTFCLFQEIKYSNSTERRDEVNVLHSNFQCTSQSTSNN